MTDNTTKLANLISSLLQEAEDNPAERLAIITTLQRFAHETPILSAKYSASK